MLTSNRSSMVTIWDAASCAEVRRIEHNKLVSDVSILRGGGVPSAVTLDVNGRVDVWNFVSGEHLRTMSAIESQTEVGVVWAQPFPSDDRIAALFGDGVAIWNGTTGEIMRILRAYPHWTFGFALSMGGDLIATCGDHALITWDTRSGEKLVTFASPAEACFIAVGLGTALDPKGFGTGLPWRQLATRMPLQA
mmetsp:Transcript_48017/g.138273  ORF Transcript_48017/g.138273 Transcript_48017/m.138273 type:complete len:193 (-) Transcript_48017:54-632(-)